MNVGDWGRQIPPHSPKVPHARLGAHQAPHTRVCIHTHACSHMHTIPTYTCTVFTPPPTSESSPNLSEKAFFLNSEQRTAVLEGDRCALSSCPPVTRRTKAIKYGNELRHREQDHQLLTHTEEPGPCRASRGSPHPSAMSAHTSSSPDRGTAEMFKY